MLSFCFKLFLVCNLSIDNTSYIKIIWSVTLRGYNISVVVSFDFVLIHFLDVVFPIELHRHQSMQSLRHRRDPHYQGNRIRKAKRVIDKSGERNIEFVNIPERGWRFFKDFVTTLVILI